MRFGLKNRLAIHQILVINPSIIVEDLYPLLDPDFGKTGWSSMSLQNFIFRDIWLKKLFRPKVQSGLKY